MSKVSASMRLVLNYLAAGCEPFGHVSGRSAHGGATQTAQALYRAGLVDKTSGNMQLTDAGRAASATPATKRDK